MKHTVCYIVWSFFLILSACGGGDGGGGGETAAPTKAVVKIKLSGSLPASTAISGVDFILTMPSNVSPALTGGDVAGDVVALVGTFAQGTQIAPVYTGATAGAKGTLRLTLVDPAVLGVTTVGETFVVVNLQVANSASPTLADFGALSKVTVTDTSYKPIAGVSAEIESVALQ